MAARFDGKVALITGGNAGIGLASAKAFAREGAKVAIAARRRIEGEEAAAQVIAQGGDAIFIETDVTNSDSIQAMVNRCVDHYGRIDIAYNNAGITGHVTTDISDADEDMFEQVMAVNVRGTWLAMKYEIRAMLAAGNGGAIVNCSSVAGLRGSVKASAYYTSKHAVIGLTKSVALEYATRGIRVNAVCPGLIKTDLIINSFADAQDKLAMLTSRIPMARAGDPEEVAAAVLWLSDPAASFVTGVALPVDGATSV